MKISRTALLFFAVVIAGAGFAGGRYVGADQTPAIEKVTTLSGKSGTPEIEGAIDFSPFWKAWNIINEKYVPNGSTSTPEKIGEQEKVWGAISGLTKSLGDPYTVFFNPEQAEMFATEVSGQFQGVGMEIGIRDGVITVVAPLKGTPAEAAGIRAGDKIIKINDKTTDDLAVDEAVRLIRGKGGTTVRLTVFRDKEGVLPEITITRAIINIPTAEEKEIVIPAQTIKNITSAGTKGGSEAKPGTPAQSVTKGATAPTTKEERANGIFVIKLFNFGGTSVDIFKDKLQSFLNSGSNKLIIDLRGNPGGYLEAAIEIASLFLPKDALIVRENFGGNKADFDHVSRGYAVFNKKPTVVVLVDRGSASAAEILAGALSEHGIAKLVGEKTFGKGSVQELVPLTDDTSIKITVARWYTPNGKSLSNGGLTPDYEITPTKEDLLAGRDPQFDKAVELLIQSSITAKR